jgi:hypothetical protein
MSPSARSATRRLRTAAAAAVVLTVAGTAFLPSAAVAAEQPGGKPLLMTLGAPTPGGPLTRGGATESMLLTVTNSSDQPQKFGAWLLGSAAGPSPLLADSVVFDVAAVDAPATKSFVGRQDGRWQGVFYPASGSKGSDFSVPAKSEFTWKVTVGLGKNYPTNDGDLTLQASPLDINTVEADPARTTVVFKTEPQITPGKLDASWQQDAGAVARPGRRAGLVLNVAATGPGEFPAELRRTVTAQAFGSYPGHPGLVLEAELDGKTVPLEETEPNTWELPPLPKGFGAASGPAAIRLYLSLEEDSDLTEGSVVPLTATFAVADSSPFGHVTTEVKAGPAVTPPKPAPTASVSPSPSAPASPPASPSATASTTPTAPATTAAATTTGGTGTGTGTTTTSATGSLAATGSGATGYTAALAAALLALGGGAAWFGARRRRTVRG